MKKKVILVEKKISARIAPARIHFQNCLIYLNLMTLLIIRGFAQEEFPLFPKNPSYHSYLRDNGKKELQGLWGNSIYGESVTMKLIPLLLVLAIVIAASMADADTLAVPGQRIDGAYLNLDYYLVQKTWGQADDAKEMDGGVTVYRNRRYLTIFYVMQGKVATIETFSTQFKTESGIKVGAHRRDVQTAYGSPDDQADYVFSGFDERARNLYCQLYSGEGIGFSYDPGTHIVYSILIFPSGGFLNVFGK